MNADLSNAGITDPAGRDGGKLVAGVSLLAGFGALASASCCALPLALSMVGIGGTMLVPLGVLAQNREIIAMAALAMIAGGWLLAMRRRRAGRRPGCSGAETCGRPPASRLTFIALGLSTGLVGLAFAYSWWEPFVIRFLWDLRTGA